MDGELIVKRDDAQEASAKLGHDCPETKAIVLLWLAAHRVLDDADTHLFGEVRPAGKNIVLEIPRELESWHRQRLHLARLQGKCA